MATSVHSSRGRTAAAIAALCALALLLTGAERAYAQAEPTCLDPRSDVFDGTSLDKDRWSAIQRENTELYTVAGGRLNLQTGPGEVQAGDAAGEAPNLILQPAPDGSWQATTKVSIPTDTAGQQAGLAVVGPGADDGVKAALVDKGTDGRRFELLKFVDGSLIFDGDWNSGFLPADFPDEFWVRLKSDGAVISGSYSPDGVTWTSIGDPVSDEAIEEPSVGVFALRGTAATAVTAGFDRFDLVPANDEFDGTEIDRCRWRVQNENAEGYALADGQLTIETLRGELSGTFSTVQNMILQAAGDSDWQATTKLTIAQTHPGQQGGLVVRGDDSNHAKIVFVRKENGQPWIEFLRTTDGETDFGGTWNTGHIPFPASVYIRLVSDGEQLSGYWSPDGETWNKVGDSRTIEGIEAPEVGLMALSGENDNPPVDADFDFFHLEPNTTVEPAPDCLTQGEPEEGFGTIFDGTQASFDNWEHAGDGFFTLNPDGSMTSGNAPEEPSYGLHWYPDAQYRNFTVRMQWKAENLTDNSGVFARFPDPGGDPDVAVNQGHEIQINENPGGDPQKTASIYNADPADHRNARPLGEWNDYQVTVVGQRYTVCLNGKTVNEYVSDKGRPLEGFIGVQNHDPASHVSFRNIRVKELPDAPDVQNIFDTIGIVHAENRENAEINGSPFPYAYIGEQMPPSRSVGVPGDDTFDDVPVRMPDTRGVEDNLASFAGQEYVLSAAQQKAYSQLHFFGATTDAQGGQASGGDFTLTFADGTVERVTVRFRDWASAGGSESDHAVIRTEPRYTTEGFQGNIPFFIYHKPVAISEANRGKVLTRITLPPNSTPGSTVTRAYLMALTLEEADGAFETPMLATNADFPNDQAPPVSTASLDPGEPGGEEGWFTEPVTVTLEAEDEEGGSQVDQIQYRIGGGNWLDYSQPIVIDADGTHVLQHRSMDRAGNLESQRTVEIKVDATAPTASVALSPELPQGGSWYDRAVDVTVEAFDARGSGVASTEISFDGVAWEEYDGPLTLEEPGVYTVHYRATDVAGHVSETQEPVLVQIDAEAPSTTLTIDGAAPVASYAAAVRVALDADDGETGSGVRLSEYRVDGGDWTAYADAPFTVSGAGAHLVEYRSVDEAGNAEPARQAAFTVTSAQPSPPPAGPPSPPVEPAPDPDPWATLERPRRGLQTLAAFRGGRLRLSVRCQSVERATLRMVVSRKQARRLGLRSTIVAGRTVRCDGGALATVQLKPTAAVRRALARRRAALPVTLRLSAGSVRDSVRLTLRGR